MKTLHINKRPRQFASRWEELTPHQVAAYCTMVYQHRSILFEPGKTKNTLKYTSKEAYYYTATSLLLVLFWHHKRIYGKATAEQKQSLISEFALTEFLQKEPQFAEQKNPFPVLATGFLFQKKLYGPVLRFDELELLEFFMADGFYFDYRMGGKVDDLDNFISILYRPKGTIPPGHPDYKGDIRLPFNINNTDLYYQWAKQLPIGQKLAVLLWFDSVRTAFSKRYAALFSASRKSKGPDKLASLKMINSLAGGIFGNLEETQRQKVLDVFTEIERLKEEADEFKKQSKQ